MERTVRGKVAVVGIGESVYYKRGESPDPEFVLACRAIRAACDDAGIDVAKVDGFASYSNDRNEPSRLAAALGTDELRFSNMQWGAGGGGVSAAVGNAAAAIAVGSAECVVVFRALAQGQFGRFGQARKTARVSGEAALTVPYGLISPAQTFAMRTMRVLEAHGVPRSTLRAVARASYHHAQNNPRAVMRGHALSEEAYDASRWIVEPYRLYDCCQENDGAAAMVLVAAERARDLHAAPVYVLGVAQGGGYRAGAPLHNDPDYAGAGFATLAPRLWRQAGVSPADVDVAQVYENFTGGVVMALIEHGLCSFENAGEVLAFENLIAPKGRLPLNTSGGNLAECYMHGLGLQLEAVRQLRGTSCNQVPAAKVALSAAGPMVPVTSTCVYGTRDTLA